MQPPEQSPVFVAALIDGWELVLMLAVALILYGLKKVPEIAHKLSGAVDVLQNAASRATRVERPRTQRDEVLGLGPFRGQTRHDVLQRTCLLLTQSAGREADCSFR